MTRMEITYDAPGGWRSNITEVKKVSIETDAIDGILVDQAFDLFLAAMNLAGFSKEAIGNHIGELIDNEGFMADWLAEYESDIRDTVRAEQEADKEYERASDES